MSKIKNFDNHQFTPISKRMGNIELRNYWFDGKDKKTLNCHLYNNYSYYEIVKWDIKRNDVGDECCYVIASWRDINDDELSPDLQFVGNRPFKLEDFTEQRYFWMLAEFGQNLIEQELKLIDNE